MTDTGSDSLHNLVENIKAAREARGWSQRELMRRLQELGVDQNQSGMSRLEKGQREPGFAELKALADIFGVSLDTLTGRTDAFDSELEWTTKRGAYLDATQALRRAATEYEKAAEDLAWYLVSGDHTPTIETGGLMHSVRRSCALIARDQYDYIGRWRDKTGLPLSEEDPAYGYGDDQGADDGQSS